MGLVIKSELGNESNVGIGLDHIRQVLDPEPGRLIQFRTFSGCGTAAVLIAIEAAKIAPGAYHDGVEQARSS